MALVNLTLRLGMILEGLTAREVCDVLIGFVTLQEEPWAVATIKEEQVDDITKEEQDYCSEA
jgi:hypothetical protein